MFEPLRCMPWVAALPSGQICNAAVLVFTGRHPDVQIVLARLAQQRERQP